MNTITATERAAVFHLESGGNTRRLEVTVNDHGLLRYNLTTPSGVPLSLMYLSEQFAKSHPAFAGKGWVRDMEALLSVYCKVTAVETPLI